jgi:ABC-type phosphate transport system substrate-binding protein
MPAYSVVCKPCSLLPSGVLGVSVWGDESFIDTCIFGRALLTNRGSGRESSAAAVVYSPHGAFVPASLRDAVHRFTLSMFKSALLFIAVVSSVAGQEGLPACGPAGGKVEVAGSNIVFPLVDAWADGYRARCPGVNVSVEAGASTAGGRRVCGLLSAGTVVDIGTLSRKWNIPAEVSITDEAAGRYICNQGDKSRKIQQVEVALDGLTMALVSGGLAAQCLRKTPGLTIAQLRWMYSNYSEIQQGLDTQEKVKAVIPNSDGNTTSRNWRELHVSCPVTNIRIAGREVTSGTAQFFQEVVFSLRASGESFETRREGGYFNSTVDETVVNYIQTSSPDIYGDAIGFFGFSFYLQEGALLYGAPIKNDATNTYVAPVRETITDDSYSPFSRRLYMQLYNNDTSLVNTKPFLAYGLSNTGTQIGIRAGLVTLPLEGRTAQLAKLGLPAPNDKAPVVPGSDPTKFEEDDLLLPAVNCGLLKLNLFCLTGCGLIGRILGLCEYT